MKKIVLFSFAVMLMGSGCKIFKGDKTSTMTDEIPTVSLYSWPFKPLSLLLPNSQIKFDVPGGKGKDFQVTTARKGNGAVVMDILPLDEYTRLEKLHAENAKKTWEVGDEVTGYLYTGMKIGEASTWMQQIKKLAKDIAEAYQPFEKYIVLEGGSIKVTGIVVKDDAGNLTVVPKGASNSSGKKVDDSY